MKARCGFISVVCLIVMCVLMVMVLYLEYITGLENLILNSAINNIQSYYLSEGKIYMILNEDKYYHNQLYPILVEYFKTMPYSKPPRDIIIEKEDLDLGDRLDKVVVDIIDRENKKDLRLKAKSNFNGLKTILKSDIKLFNEVVEMEIPVLDTDSIETEYKEKLKDLLLNISNKININNCSKPNNIYGIDLLDFNNIVLDNEGNDNFKISAFRDTMLVPYTEIFNDKEIFIILRSSNDHPTNFFVGSTYTPNQLIKLSGIIYVEGNITISKDFQFNGIIIVKNGDIKIDYDVKIDIKGLSIVQNITNNDFLENPNMFYSRHFVYKYGIYLPGFVETKINSIKID
ncbi:hypothetical protein [Tissierella praeacuta]|uniref:hypothetical protein n=1 Tax=Tissierella praeacuta TaxID=43131 RepID=UPI0028A6BE73|nr:hypothetical protein [Tissierella praeacuta]